MKSIKSHTLFLALSLFLCCLSSNSSYYAKNLATPKASGLKNAYGAPINNNPYGPQGNPYAQYIEANPDTFTPFKFDGKKKIQNTLTISLFAYEPISLLAPRKGSPRSPWLYVDGLRTPDGEAISS